MIDCNLAYLGRDERRERSTSDEAHSDLDKEDKQASSRFKGDVLACCQLLSAS